MKSNIMEESDAIIAAQARLFINVGIVINGDIAAGTFLNPNRIHASEVSYALADAIAFREAMYRRMERCYAWRSRVADLKLKARNRLRDRLVAADRNTRPYDPNALGHRYRSSMPLCLRPFAPLADAVRSTIKAARVGDRAEQRAGKQRLIELAYNCGYTSLVYEVMGKHWSVLHTAVENAQYRFITGHWKKPVWAGSNWSDRHPSHFVHASRETPGNVAFYPDTDKLEADKLTSMKSGRYLATFYGDVLTDEQIKQWANKQVASTQPTPLKFVGNDDPLGWVWVYENSAPSCMRYNRHNRYINSELNGAMHPVTVYAHPENHLALAYMMLPGEVEDRTVNCGKDEHVVGARAIVNKASKTYLRIYANGDVQYPAMKEALERAGYTESGSTLRNEKLRLVEVSGGYLCPYLDGDYTHITVRSNHLLIGNGDMCARETSGYVCEDEEDRRCCDRCGESYHEDDGRYVDSEDAWVCDDCISEHYAYAIGRNGNTELLRVNNYDIIYCDYDGRYYITAYLGDNDMGMTEDGEVYPDDQLVETTRGVYHSRDAVELTYEFDDYAWAHRDDAYRLPNGETCHVDDEDKIAEIEALEQEAA